MYAGTFLTRRSPQKTALLTAALLALGTGSAAHAQEAAARNTGGLTRTLPPTARGTVKTTIAIATRAIQRGDTLHANDFTTVDTTLTWRWSMPANDTVLVQAGWVANRAIAEGEVLRMPSVQPPALITAGATVRAIYIDGPVKLELTGIALNSAPHGAVVGIRTERGRRLEGIVTGPNTVRLR